MRPATMVIVCSISLLIISMGVRATTGLFQLPMTQAHGWTRESFAFAFALQNLVWGLANPFFGAVADRFGSGRAIVAGAILYTVGLVLMRYVETPGELYVASGVLIGLGLSGTTFSVILGVVSRRVSPERRSLALGFVAAGGSMGQFLMLPAGYFLIGALEWYGALLALALMAALMVPFAAGLTGRSQASQSNQSMSEALREALAHPSFHLIVLGYFTCGFHTAFITLHFPAYTADVGLTVDVGVRSLALVGLFNVIGTYTAGALGDKYSKKYLLSGLYFGRAIVILVFLLAPKTPLVFYLFSASLGFLWLGTVPLTNGLIATIYGTKYISMLTGLSFMGHQIGGFLGAWSGGLVFDMYKSYDPVWWFSVAVGVTAALFYLPVAERPILRPATAG
ncbi:MAG: MFS transporter [Burkholderiales bacterium]